MPSELAFLRELAPVVAVSFIWAWVLVRFGQSNEKLHAEKTKAFLTALADKDKIFQDSVNMQFTRTNATMEKLTSILEKIDVKISWGTKNIKLKK